MEWQKFIFLNAFLLLFISGALAAAGPEFVSVQSGKFYLQNQPFYFSGSNAYYLNTYEKVNPAYVTQTLDMFVAANATVVRMWGFQDGTDCGYWTGDPVLQVSPGVYNETALRLMDSVVKKAKDRNLKLVISFVNFWGDLGGICQYNKWAGYNGSQNPTHNEATFFHTNAATKQWYKNYVSMILNRVNTQTGVAYKDEPAIMAWELMNEAEIPSETDSTILRNWYQEMAQHIKSIDQSHLVTTGEQGFDNGMDYAGSPYSRNLSNTYVLRAGEGTSYYLNVQIPEIDFGQIHIYPDAFGFSTANNYTAWIVDSITYMNDHARIAASFGKPLLIGEYGSGWYTGYTADSPFKQSAYSSWWRNIEQQDSIGGALIWQFATGAKCSESGGNICATRDSTLTSLFNQHGIRMNAKTGGALQDLAAPTVSAAHSPTSPTSAQNVTLSASASDASGIRQIQIFIDNALAKTCNSTTSCAVVVGPYATSTTHTYYSTATDSSNNSNIGRDPSSGAKSFTVAAAPPPVVYSWPSTPLRGIGLGNPGLSTITESDFIKLKGWGVNVVRVHLLGVDPSSYSTQLNDLERIVNLSEKYNIKVVVALMSMQGVYGNDVSSPFWTDFALQDQVIDFWKGIANRFKGRGSVIAGYDLINEPAPTGDDRGDSCPTNCPATPNSPKDLGYFYSRTISAIRAIDPSHTIVVESRCYGQLCWKKPDASSPYQYAVSMPVLSESNIVYSFHWYNPLQYTHQGVSGNPTNISYPGSVQYYGYFDAARTRTEMMKIRDFAQANNAKIFIGEYSVASWAPNGSVWLNDVTNSYDEFGFSTSYHHYDEYEGWNLEVGSPDRLNAMKSYWTQAGAPADTTTPAVSISHSPASPTNTQQVTYAATATDASGIRQIQIYVDGQFVRLCNATTSCNITAGPYGASTQHTYYATATDNSANANVGRDPASGAKSFTVAAQPPSGGMGVYAETALNSPWTFSQSYGGANDPANANPAYSGSTSLKADYRGWGDLNLRYGDYWTTLTIDPAQYSSLDFAAHGGTGGVVLRVALGARDSGGGSARFAQYKQISVPANSWVTYSFPMNELDSNNTPFNDIGFTVYQGANATFYLDNIKLAGSGGSPTNDTTAPNVSISHLPASPSSLQAVNLTAIASDVSGIRNITIFVDNAAVRTCIGSTGCTYVGGPYAASTTHTYYATAADNSNNSNMGRYPPNGTRNFTVSQASYNGMKNINHPYPRIGLLQWGGGNVDWFCRHDLVILPPTEADTALQMQSRCPSTYIIATNDWNAGGIFQPTPHTDVSPEPWIVRTSTGARVLYGDGLMDVTSYALKYNGTISANYHDYYPLMPSVVSINNETYSEALARAYMEYIDWNAWDGINSDGTWVFPYNSGDIDLNRNGVNDYTEFGGVGSDAAYNAIQAIWIAGYENLFRLVRSKMQEKFGGQKIITYWTVGNYMDHGALMGSNITNGVGWEMASYLPPTWTLFKPTNDAWNSVGPQPRINWVDSTIAGDTANAPARNKDYFRFMRFMLTATLRGDNYFMQEDGESFIDSGAHNEHFWHDYYDEFDVQLGYPTGAAQQLASGAWVRFFDNGVSISNIGSSAITVSDTDLRTLSGYAGPYYRFRGNQDPAWNNGQQFTSAALASTASGNLPIGDGILLVKTPITVVSDIIVDNAYAGTSPGSAQATLAGFLWDQGATSNIRHSSYYVGARTDNDAIMHKQHYASAGSGSATAVFRPTINVPGQYQVYEWHGWYGASQSSVEATNVPVQIRHASGVSNLAVNQRSSFGQWNLIGTYNFTAGGNASVSISNNANGYVIADAFKFVYMGGNGTADVIAPNVSITSPANNSVVNGTISLAATASDNVAVAGVQFKLDGAAIGAEDTASPYSYSWNTSFATNGLHSISATARDAAGNSRTSAIVRITVSNPVALPPNDTTAPNISVTHSPVSPTSSQPVAYTATAADASGIRNITIFVDSAAAITCAGATSCTHTGGPYAANSMHTYYATATDNSPNANVGRDPASGAKGFSVASQPPAGSYAFPVIAYYGTWATNYQYFPSDIDFNIVTHAIQFSVPPSPSVAPYFDAAAADSTLKGLAQWDPRTGRQGTDFQLELINSAHARGKKALLGFAAVEAYQPGLPAQFGLLLSDPAKTDQLAAALLNYARTRGYDGIDINWEYPSVADRGNFNTFMMKLRQGANGEPGLDSWSPRGILTITGDTLAVNPANRIIDVNGVNSYVDYLLVESAYRFIGGGNAITGNPAGIYHTSGCTNFDSYTFADTTGFGGTYYVTANGWSAAGVQKGKIAQIIPFYANLFTGADGPCQNKGYYGVSYSYYPPGYGDILNTYYQPSRYAHDAPTGANYLHWVETNGDLRLLEYEDPSTIAEKINMLKTRGFGAVALYSLSDGVVLKQQFPSWTGTRDILLQAVGSALGSNATGNATDTMPPNVSITSPANNSAVNGAITIAATASDNVAVAGVQFRLDGAAIGTEDTASPYSYSWNTSFATNGLHSISATARDSSNNTKTATISVNVSNAVAPPADTTAPNVSVSHLPASPMSTEQVTITANASDASGIRNMTIFVDSSSVRTCTGASTCIYIGGPYAAYSTHTYYATATDNSANANVGRYPATGTRSFLIVLNDTAAPNVSITHTPTSPNSSQAVTYTATAADVSGIRQIQITVDGAAVQTCSSNTTCTYIGGPYAANSTHTYYATATDNSLNLNIGRDPASGTKGFSVPDTSPPNVSITYPAAGAIVSGSITVSANASDNLGVAGVQFKLDGVNLGAEDTIPPYSTSWNTRTAANGLHNLSATARDTAGNNRAATISPSVSNIIANNTTDTTAPNVSVAHSPAVPTSLAQVTFTANASDASGIRSMQIYVDGSAAQNCTGSTCSFIGGPYAAYSTHTYYATATDNSANANVGRYPATGTRNFTVSFVDTAAPNVSITSPANNSAVNGAITIAATASDNVAVAGVQFRLDGAAIGTEDTASPYSYSWNTSFATNGLHSISATARDSSNNTKDSAVVRVTVSNAVANNTTDTTVPLVSVSHSPSSPDTNDRVAITAQASDAGGIASLQVFVDNATLANCTASPCSTAGLRYSSGMHSYYATATDNSTNANRATTPVYSFNVSGKGSLSGGAGAGGGGGSGGSGGGRGGGKHRTGTVSSGKVLLSYARDITIDSAATTVTLTAMNTQDKPVKKFSLKDRMPGKFATDPTQLSFSLQPEHLESGSIIAVWKFVQLDPGESVTMVYSVPKPISVEPDDFLLTVELEPAPDLSKEQALANTTAKLVSPASVVVGDEVVLQLRDINDKPLSNAVVSIKGPNGVSVDYTTDSDGFVFFHPESAGSYDYSAKGVILAGAEPTVVGAKKPSAPPTTQRPSGQAANEEFPASTVLLVAGIIGFGGAAIYLFFRKPKNPPLEGQA